MVRPRRPAWQVVEAKQKIFSAALELFNRQGYEEVSIRKIARKAGCAPATIYNYYRDKDALYLDLLKKGFEILFDLLTQSTCGDDPFVCLRRFAEAYFQFSQAYPYYYDIMFLYPVPKYLDYVGTEAERAAREEKVVALKSFRLLTKTAADVLGPGDDALQAAAELLALAHGCIALNRSGIWAELDADFHQLYFSAVDGYLGKLKTTSRQ
jgi:AcrR family transcriptional regulator